MSVFVDDLVNPALVVSIDIAATLDLDCAGSLWVGFTAATASAYENHDILSWSFTEVSPDCNDNMTPDVCELNEGGNALRFDGGNDWVNIPDLSLAGDFTIEAWVRIDGGISGHDALVGQEGGGQDINFSDARIRLWAPSDVIIANTVTVPDAWTHYAITRSGSDLALYYNGVPDAVGTWSGAFTPKAIGRGNMGFLGGRLDEFRIWSVARTPEEILEDYDRAVLPSSAGLLVYYNMNQWEDEQTVVDASSGAHHGTRGADATASSDDPSWVLSTAPLPTLDANGNGIPDVCELPGDLNCDGVINNFDIDPFVLALTSAGHPTPCDDYYAVYPECDCMLADTNGDGSVNNFDIDPFVDLLT